MECIDLIRALVDNIHDNPRDDIEEASTCTSPRVYYLNEERVNTPINDISNGEEEF